MLKKKKRTKNKKKLNKKPHFKFLIKNPILLN